MKNILEMLENTCSQYPNNLAISDGDREITYRDYLNLSQLVGTYIYKLVGNTNKPILVLSDSSIDSIIAFMGIVYSGNFYVPIDIKQPDERIYKIIKNLSPGLIIDTGKTGNSFDVECKVIDYDKILKDKNIIDYDIVEKVRKEQIISDPLFAIATSGSTGDPKIVLKDHFSVLDMVKQFSKEFTFASTSIFGNQAPFHFDISAKDIYISMFHGARMDIIPRQLFSFPTKLIDYMNTKEINTLIWSTFGLRLLYNFNAFKNKRLDFIKLVMFSGESMPNKVLNYWRNSVDALYVNLYGTTETTFNCIFHRVEESYSDEDVLPIGKSFENTKVLLLKDNNERVGPGELGEICVIGSTLAIGYYKNLEKTNQVFCQNPLNQLYPERMYRTGDMGYYDENANIVFVSRKDHQIKHMGYLIEMDEIELAFNSIDGIEASCCIYDHINEKIIVPYQSKTNLDKTIYTILKEKFPKYMLPNKLVQVEELPLNRNGKIDRVLIKESFINVKKN